MKQQLLEKSEEISAQNEELLQINEELLQTNEVLAEARLKAEESDKLKTAILQNISHEIRTPLNAIMGFTKLIPLVLDQKENLGKYSRIIVQSGENLLSIINNLFDAARIDSGQLTIRKSEFKLDTILSDIVAYFKEYQRRTSKQHIELIIEENSDFLNHSVCSDDLRLRQILINLIENAFKFTEKGKITIGCKQILNSTKEYIFSVKDTGIGIETEKLSYIFEPFTQIELSISRKYSGTGLGLSIAKGLVNLLGGKIWVESEVNKGSSFYFSIPA
jgi:signal transduction histidine kinase